MIILNSMGSMTSYLGEGKDSRGGYLQTFNRNGQPTSYAGTNIHGTGILEVNNEYGVVAGSIESSHDRDIYDGDGVIKLFNERGEFGWIKDGKSKQDLKIE